MKKSPNGILPIVAIILTCAVGALSAFFFIRSHIFWGIVFALIFIDFFADMILSFKKA